MTYDTMLCIITTITLYKSTFHIGRQEITAGKADSFSGVHCYNWSYSFNFLGSKGFNPFQRKEAQPLISVLTGKIIIIEGRGNYMLNAVLFVGFFLTVTLFVYFMVARDIKKTN